MSRAMTPVDDRLYQYLVNHSVREPDVLTAIREETHQLGRAAAMQICPEQGQLLAMLVQMIGAKRIIEIGTFTGYSSTAMAMAVPDDGHLLCCDVNEEWTTIAQHYWQKACVSNKITLKLAPALETLEALMADNQQNSFDMAFIDADKANYSNYYEGCLKLVRTGGLICIDNVLWDGFVADPEITNNQTQSIRALNTLVAGDERVTPMILAIGDGMTVCLKQ